MAIVKVRGTLKEARPRARVDIARAERARGKRARADITRLERGLFSPKLKRPRVDDFGNFSRRHGSLQSSEHEDHNSVLRNLRSDKARDDRIREERSRDGRFRAERARHDRGWAERARSDRGRAHVARVERARAYRARADRILFTPKLKRPKPRVESHGSMQGNEREDYYRLDCDLVKSSNLQLGKISQFSVQHVGIVKTTTGESFPSPSVVKENSVKSKEDENTSRQGLTMRQPLSDYYHSDTTVTCGTFDVSQQHVSCLEVKDLSEVKGALEVLEDTSRKSRKQNRHKTNIASGNVEHTDRARVKGALEAYKEILILTMSLTKWRAQNCNIYVQAAMDLKKQGKWVNTMKQMGSIGGVRVGDKFRYRAQLNIIGLHKQFNDGIDRIRRNDGKVLAISIVDSGRYANNLQSSDILIYSGHGGKALYDKTKPTNQIMQGGNLALKNSQEEGTPIRVIRKLKNSNGSCYVYYGLYTVEEVMEKRELGVMTYKFRLRRKPGQPELSFDS